MICYSNLIEEGDTGSNFLTFKIYSNQSHSQKHHHGAQKWQIYTVLPILYAVPEADSTNRSQNPWSPDVSKNPFQQSPQATITK